MIEVSPCKDCTERYVACHDSCEKYGEWRHKLDLENAAKRSTWQEHLGIKRTKSQMERMKRRR